MSTAQAPVRVVAAIIWNNAGEILIAKRPPDKHQGGLWEFPGGKLEQHEAPEVGLAREIFEELGIKVVKAAPFLQITHEYPDKSVFLDVWKVDSFSGEAFGKEGQEIRWVQIQQLIEFEFPEANKLILESLA